MEKAEHSNSKTRNRKQRNDHDDMFKVQAQLMRDIVIVRRTLIQVVVF